MAMHSFFRWGRLALAGLLISGLAQAEASSDSATITVNVGPLRNGKGSLACRLHASAEGFPRTGTGLVSRRVKIAGASTQCVFDHVAPGTYAVVVLHDENDNRQCDRNRFGVPIEGYGASNNHTHALSAPTWQESKFQVEAGKERTLSIVLRY